MRVLVVSYGVLFAGRVTIIKLDSMVLEVVWTLLPILILIRIAVPRIYLLCLQDTLALAPANTVKLLRNQ